MNDLISREALKIIIEQNQLVNAKLSVYDVLKIIDNAPSVFSCNACKNMGNEWECRDCHDYSNYVHYGGQIVPDVLQGWRYEERPQGEWDETAEWRFTHYIKHYICNNCFKYAPHNSKTNFCPNCGAKMQKGGTDEKS